MTERTDIETMLRRSAEAMRPSPPPDAIAIIERAWGQRRRRRRLVGTVAAGLAVLTLTGGVVAVAGNTGAPARVAAGPSIAATGANATAASIARYGWTQLPPAPIAGRTFAASVWTGREMLVWGGASASDALFRDGAAFDPAKNTWRRLPPSPLSRRSQAVAVWTGHEMVVWGGRGPGQRVLADGAAYDPSRDSWRTIAESPLAGRRDATAVWTGSTVLVLGGESGKAGALTTVAAYDPADDSWVSMPPMPAGDHPPLRIVAARAGAQVFVWNLWQRGATGASGIDLLVHDAGGGDWRSVRETPGAPLGVADAFWTGAELVVPPARPWSGDPGATPDLADLPGARYTPATDTWHGITPGPVADTVGRDVWTGSALIRLTDAAGGARDPGAAVLWDPASGAWTQLRRQSPVISVSGDATVWTGSELLVWGEVENLSAFTQPPSSAAAKGGVRLGP